MKLLTILAAFGALTATQAFALDVDQIHADKMHNIFGSQSSHGDNTGGN